MYVDGVKMGVVWSKLIRKIHDTRAEVLDSVYRLDVIALVETWLKGDEVIGVECYVWFGRNRRSLHRKAVRGSGGVGLLIHTEELEGWEIEVLDTDVVDVVWVRLS